MRFRPFAVVILAAGFAPGFLHAQNIPASATVTSSSPVYECGPSGNLERKLPDRDLNNVPNHAPERDAQTPDNTATPLLQQAADPARCSSTHASDELPDPASCEKVQLANFESGYDGRIFDTVLIWRLAAGNAFFYESGMTIDADGAPNAYHPDNIGLDDLANAGGPGSWPGLAKDRNGEPIIQGPDDPYPGYYVSATALADRDKPFNDPARYVDATKIPFIVLPGDVARQAGARPGDFAVVFNLRNRKSSPAIFADVGPPDHLGEGSIALAENLGIRSDARNGGTRGQVVWLVFAGSGNGRPRPLEEINSESNRLLDLWGGAMRLDACMGDDSSAQ